MLRLNGVSVYHGHIRAVDNLTLEVHPGEIVCLLGSNGAGKTSTLMAISGIYRCQRGTISFGDERLDLLTAEAVVRRGVCQVPEGRRIFAGLTVQENLRIGSYRHGYTGPRLGVELDRVYEVFPRLRERRGQRAGTLSGGEQQMLAIGRALMAAPRVLLLDEPSLGLAPRLVHDIFAKVREINAMGTSILLVEQNVPVALAVAHRGYILETGRVVLSGTSAELAKDPRVREAYLGRERPQETTAR